MSPALDYEAKTVSPPFAEQANHSGDRPTPAQIDDLVLHFETIRDELELADERYENCKEDMIALVQRFGSVPAGAEKSVRLEGRVNVLTVTAGNTSSIDDSAVVDLFNAMKANKKVSLFYQMFFERMKYEERKDAAVHLRTAKLSKRLVKLFTDLYARCTKTKKKSPSLRIERIDAKLTKKPAKKGGRA